MTADQLTNLHGSNVKAFGIVRRLYFYRKGSFFLLLVFLLSSLFFSCASHPVTQLSEPEIVSDENSFIPKTFVWTSVCSGIDSASYNFPSFPVRYHAVRISLETNNLEITAFPSKESDFKNKNGRRTSLFTGMRTPVFAKKSGTTVAVNTSPFAGKSGKWNSIAKITRTRQIVGTHIVNGKELSKPVGQYAALVFYNKVNADKNTNILSDNIKSDNSSNLTAKIIDSQTEASLSGADFAFGGFFTILRDGEFKRFTWTSNDSRSAAGVSEDGRTLYLLVVEGENRFQSKGLSFPECAAVLKAMGADDALEFDGGGSSCICVNGRSIMSYPVLRTGAAEAGFTVKNTDANIRFH